MGLREGCTSGFLARSPHSFLVSVSRWGLQRVMKRLLAASCPHSNGIHSAGTLVGPEGPEPHVGAWFRSRIPHADS